MRVERYSFSLNPRIVIGTPSRFAERLIYGHKRMKTDTLHINLIERGFIRDVSVEIGREVHLIGDGVLADRTLNTELREPKRSFEVILEEYSVVRVSGQYTGLVPPGLSVGFDYLLSFTLQGTVL